MTPNPIFQSELACLLPRSGRLEPLSHLIRCLAEPWHGQPRSFRLLAGGVLLFLLWASVFEIEQTVSAQGLFIPDIHAQGVQPVEHGVLPALGGQERTPASSRDGVVKLLELRIKPADIGQLRVGQSAQLRLDTYDYTLNGSLEGELVYLSPDTLSEPAPNGQGQSYYRGRVRISPEAAARNPRLAALDLRPGITASVDIRTGQRSVLTYLIKRLARALGATMDGR
jgi:hypothetical protein